MPLANVVSNPAHLEMLEQWMQSYEPERLFDKQGRLIERLAQLAPKGNRRMGQNPHANGGKLMLPLEMPDYAEYAVPGSTPGGELRRSTERFGMMLRDIYRLNQDAHNFRLFCPDEINSNRLGAVFEVENRCSMERTRATTTMCLPPAA